MQFVQVQYDATGFLEQNSDTLQPDTIQLLSSSDKKILNCFASGVMNQFQTTRLAAYDSHEQSVAGKFKVTLRIYQHLVTYTLHTAWKAIIAYTYMRFPYNGP